MFFGAASTQAGVGGRAPHIGFVGHSDLQSPTHTSNVVYIHMCYVVTHTCVHMYIHCSLYRTDDVQWNLLNEYPEGDRKLVLIIRGT